MSTIVIQVDEARKLVIKKLTEAGLHIHHAEKMADVLVHADLRNVNSHGVLRTEHYVSRLQAGGINLEAHPTFTQSGPVTGVVDGDDGFGHVIADMAMDHMMTELQSVEPAPRFERVYVPGEIEQLHEERNRVEGISIALNVYEFLTK